MNKPLTADGGTALIEVTKKCYCGCPYCYKGKLVSPKGIHLPLKLIESRIQWLCRHVECDEIMLIGGDPILHPDMEKIIWKIIRMGKVPGVITAGRISHLPHEIANYQILLKLYERGLINLEVSYQSGRNDRYYIQMVNDLRARYEARRLNLQKLGRYNETKFDFVSSAVVDAENINWDAYYRLVVRVMTLVYKEGPDEDNIPSIKEAATKFQSHFSADFDTSEYNSMTVYSNDEFRGFRAKVRFMGKITIRDIGDGLTAVSKPKGGSCPAMCDMSGDSQELDSITIREDGHLTFSRPECITVHTGLCNVDLHQGDQVLKVVRASLSAIQAGIVNDKRLSASSPGQYCMDDPLYDATAPGAVKCTSCPFNLSCNTCHLTERQWKED